MAVRDRDVAPVRAGADTWHAVTQENVEIARLVLDARNRRADALKAVGPSD
jgi:hypothetical protein